MSFDIRHAFRVGWAESQIGEGGHNASNNCVPAACSNAMLSLGYPDAEPQDWTDAEYGPGFRGYTTLDAAVDFIGRHFRDPPPIWQGNPTDTLGAIDEAGRQGHPNVVIMTIDGNVNFAPWGGGFHASNVVAHDGNAVTVLNVWHGTLDVLDVATFRACTAGSNAGSMLLFGRPVIGEEDAHMTPQERFDVALAIVRLFYEDQARWAPPEAVAWAQSGAQFGIQAMTETLLRSDEANTNRAKRAKLYAETTI